MDDLSFEEFEIEYKYLKAVIEGLLFVAGDQGVSLEEFCNITEKGKDMLDAEYSRILAQAQDYRAIFGKEETL